MAIGALNAVSATVPAGVTAALQGKTAAPAQNPTLAAITITNQTSTTSVTGQVTTVITYADGSVRTEVSEGDSVILSSTRHSR